MTVLERKIFLQNVFALESTRRKWAKVVHMFGIVPDKKIARKLGVTSASVCYVRGKMRIPPANFERICEKYQMPYPTGVL